MWNISVRARGFSRCFHISNPRGCWWSHLETADHRGGGLNSNKNIWFSIVLFLHISCLMLLCIFAALSSQANRDRSLAEDFALTQSVVSSIASVSLPSPPISLPESIPESPPTSSIPDPIISPGVSSIVSHQSSSAISNSINASLSMVRPPGRSYIRGAGPAMLKAPPPQSYCS